MLKHGGGDGLVDDGDNDMMGEYSKTSTNFRMHLQGFEVFFGLQPSRSEGMQSGIV